jgi:tRNA 2-thiouridine synthesizing protein A
VWDADDLGCGELVLELRHRLEALRPRQILRLVAADAGAPADVPAWCRMTGHRLVAADPPVYLIERKEP